MIPPHVLSNVKRLRLKKNLNVCIDNFCFQAGITHFGEVAHLNEACRSRQGKNALVKHCTSSVRHTLQNCAAQFVLCVQIRYRPKFDGILLNSSSNNTSESAIYGDFTILIVSP